jgi:hypothetical protein
MAITPQRRATVIHGHYTTDGITVDLLCGVMAMYYC